MIILTMVKKRKQLRPEVSFAKKRKQLGAEVSFAMKRKQLKLKSVLLSVQIFKRRRYKISGHFQCR